MIKSLPLIAATALLLAAATSPASTQTKTPTPAPTPPKTTTTTTTPPKTTTTTTNTANTKTTKTTKTTPAPTPQQQGAATIAGYYQSMGPPNKTVGLPNGNVQYNWTKNGVTTTVEATRYKTGVGQEIISNSTSRR